MSLHASSHQRPVSSLWWTSLSLTTTCTAAAVFMPPAAQSGSKSSVLLWWISLSRTSRSALLPVIPYCPPRARGHLHGVACGVVGQDNPAVRVDGELTDSGVRSHLKQGSIVEEHL